MYERKLNAGAKGRIAAGIAALLLFAVAIPAAAQAPDSTQVADAAQAAPAPPMVETVVMPNLAAGRNNMPAVEMQYFRPHDARGLNTFEAPKVEGAAYTGNKIQW